jgi:hypothetical protein
MHVLACYHAHESQICILIRSKSIWDKSLQSVLKAILSAKRPVKLSLKDGLFLK